MLGARRRCHKLRQCGRLVATTNIEVVYKQHTSNVHCTSNIQAKYSVHTSSVQATYKQYTSSVRTSNIQAVYIAQATYKQCIVQATYKQAASNIQVVQQLMPRTFPPQHSTKPTLNFEAQELILIFIKHVLSCFFFFLSVKWKSCP